METSPTPDPDIELLERWRDGDGDAGKVLLRRHFEPLRRFFRNKVGDGVDDLIQQTMLGLVKSRDTFRGDASFRTYLFTIARNALYTRLRTTKKERDVFDPGEHSVHDMGTSPSRMAARNEEQKLMLLALRRLPVDLQVALELFYWEDLSTEELAQVLDIPPGTVKSRLRRAKEKLQWQMERIAGSKPLLESTMGNLDQWAGSVRNAMGDEDADD
jgi:RNA polymerase sigma factor (sigma-70 family)